MSSEIDNRNAGKLKFQNSITSNEKKELILK